MCASAFLSNRRGATSYGLAVGAVVALSVALWFVFFRRATDERQVPAGEPLLAFVAASNQPVFEAVRRDYEQATGVAIQVQYGASQTLLAGIEVSKSGDLYLPADDSYLTTAREKRLTGDVFPLATMKPVVVVVRGNPKRILKWDDLLRPDVRLALASPEAAAVGRLTREALSKSGRWEALDRHKAVETSNVTEVANAVKIGGVDAGIIFDAMLHDYETLEALPLGELQEAQARIAAAVLTTSRRPDAALRFARYLAGRDQGLRRYREFGFAPIAPTDAAAEPATPAARSERSP